jgi:hypothetical protein
MTTRTISFLRAALIGCAALGTASALAGGEAGRLNLRDLGARFVGYAAEPQDNGSLNVVNAMFVQYLLPARRRHEYPIVMIHGGGGQGTDWLETPDGRDGWADYFAADGWAVARRATPAAATGLSASATPQSSRDSLRPTQTSGPSVSRRQPTTP